MYTIQSYVTHLKAMSILINKDYYALTKIDDLTTNDSLKETIIDCLYRDILIQTNCFIEEYNLNINGKDIRFKKATNILIKRIKKWDGLKKFRDNVLAHNYRVKELKYKSVFEIDENFKNYNIPNNINDLLILIGCLNQIIEILAVFFPKETSQYETIIKKHLSKTNKKTITKKNAQLEIAALKKQTIELINKLQGNEIK